MRKFAFIALIMLISGWSVSAQLSLPRESQRQTITQTIGDASVSIVYHRPNVKGRKIWGGLQPYDQVWRAGANENTTFEITRDVTIDGKPLPAGKYGFHIIPGKTDWIVIFNKVNNEWGSFKYDQKDDALRVTVKPGKIPNQETLSYNFDDVGPHTAKISVRWEKIVVPFTLDTGDVTARMMAQIRDAVKNRKTDDRAPLNQGANYVFTFKVKENYDEAMGWLDTSLGLRETFGSLVLKARLLAEMGKRADAIVLGEKALAMGKTTTPPATTTDLEKYLAEWKASK